MTTIDDRALPTVTPSGAAHCFRRIEEKFFVPKSELDELIRQASSRMSTRYPDPETRYNGIESVYFDSEDLELFRDHFLRQDRRFKIRTRRYAPNGRWSDDALFLEIKSKTLEISEKLRFKISGDDLLGLRTGGRLPVSHDMIRRNDELEIRDLLKRVAQANAALTEHRLRPRCRIRYFRHEFQSDEARITIDQNIQIHLLQPISRDTASSMDIALIRDAVTRMNEAFGRKDSVLLEVKHSGKIPPWLDDFLDEREIREVSFSKYCFGIAKHLLPSSDA